MEVEWLDVRRRLQGRLGRKRGAGQGVPRQEADGRRVCLDMQLGVGILLLVGTPTAAASPSRTAEVARALARTAAASEGK